MEEKIEKLKQAVIDETGFGEVRVTIKIQDSVVVLEEYGMDFKEKPNK